MNDCHDNMNAICIWLNDIEWNEKEVALKKKKIAMLLPKSACVRNTSRQNLPYIMLYEGGTVYPWGLFTNIVYLGLRHMYETTSKVFSGMYLIFHAQTTMFA